MNAHGLSAHEKRVLRLIDEQEVIGLLQALIQQPSTSPPGDCRKAIAVVAEKLGQAGVSCRTYAKDTPRPNVVAELPSVSGRPVLTYHAHVDTVPIATPGLWTVNPFGGEVADGRIYGRGSGDDKSSVVAQIMAAITIARAGIALAGKLQVVAVADEETGGLVGTKWLRDEGLLTPDYLLVGEQTRNYLALAERVACGIDLTVFGKSAHGALPWQGDNAVLKAAHALTWLQDELFPQLEGRTHQYLPPATLNVGTIEGGVHWNVVPDRCVVKLDRRLLPGETRAEAMAEVQRILDAHTECKLRYELSSEGEVAPNINTSPEAPFVRCAQEALRVCAGQERPLTGYTQTSDGRWFAGAGIPIIVFGPGDPMVAHSTDEYTLVEEVIEATRFLTILALRWSSALCRVSIGQE